MSEKNSYHHKNHRLAANAIRGKLKNIYKNEPSALQELAESDSDEPD
jgi:hypothetical protein